MNPDGPEFETALAAGCTSSDRPDLVSRVFRLKLCALMDDLTKICIFGRTKAFLYTVEWQKRGLPHCHVLLWLEHKIDKTDIDNYISAEIPDPNTSPKLYKIVTTNMIHNPCVGYDESSPCIIKNKCSKNFPKPYRKDTFVCNNGYPLYRRRAFGEDGGRCFERKRRRKEDKMRIDNAWVVPYNPYLYLKYNAHINVECCNSIKCIAYVTKYVNKGSDRIVKAMGLMKDKDHWEKTLMEIVNHTNNGKDLRSTYTTMLVFCDLEDQSEVCLDIRDYFASDFLYKSGKTHYNDEIYLDALDEIQEYVYNCGGADITKYGLPASRGLEKSFNLLRREKSYNTVQLIEDVREKLPLLNKEQREIFDAVIGVVGGKDRGKGKGFFIDAPGGTGKSFLLNLLLDAVRSKRGIALAVASSGITATVLHGGRTAHNMFKIPLMESHELRSCSIKKNTQMSKLLGMCSLIVWDEVVMANKNMLLAVDITLRDLLSANEFMGGIPFVCAGDFRQILPVVKGGGSNQEISATIRNTYFWEELRKYALTENLRLRGPDEHGHNKIFAEFLLQSGHAASGPFAIPENFGVVYYDQKEFINSVYQDLIDHVGDHRYFSSRVIISPLNVDVTEINKVIQNMLPGTTTTTKVYLSEDKLESDDDVDYQISTLNEINPASLPVHCLELKIGSVVMVIRNISPPRICNGTRVIVDNLKKNIIVGRILGGIYDGEQITIVRIKLVSSDSPVNFSRFQFPVKLSFAMTINKSQGQTIQKCGLYLYGTKCFSHGQLYVACSRVTSWDALSIYLKPLKKDEIPTLENVLYPEVFNELETMKEEYSRLDSRVLIRQEDAEEDNELMRIYIPRSGGLSKEEINAFFAPEISSEDFEDVKERLEKFEEVEEKP
ncbi:uncharacterized protein LOC143023519 [Oratosquilla oratoria]|uniref:uncharacterized protein LOC143023519 n=1 Tax=Oratosquilla oratoria TaxID=337810 RepID=UPI003F76E974